MLRTEARFGGETLIGIRVHTDKAEDLGLGGSS